MAKKYYRLHADWYRLSEIVPAGSVVHVEEKDRSKWWTEVDSQGRPIAPSPAPEPEPESTESLVVDIPEQEKLEVHEVGEKLEVKSFPVEAPAVEAKPDTGKGKSKRPSDKDW